MYKNPTVGRVKVRISIVWGQYVAELAEGPPTEDSGAQIEIEKQEVVGDADQYCFLLIENLERVVQENIFD